MSRVASRVARVARRGDAPAAALAIALFCAMASVQPSILTQTGLDLTLLGIVPLALASVAQMIIMVGGDIDLSLGSALGLVNAIAATQLSQHVWVGVAELVAFLVGYVVMGAVVEFRALPSLIVTFAFAFIWGGFALVVLPTPGGTSPNWMSQIFTYTVPGVPEPILILVALGFASWGFSVRNADWKADSDTREPPIIGRTVRAATFHGSPDHVFQRGRRRDHCGIRTHRSQWCWRPELRAELPANEHRCGRHRRRHLHWRRFLARWSRLSARSLSALYRALTRSSIFPRTSCLRFRGRF